MRRKGLLFGTFHGGNAPLAADCKLWKRTKGTNEEPGGPEGCGERVHLSTVVRDETSA